MQTVFQKTLESTMYYHNIPVFIYKIRYPFFTTTCSSAAARKINQYYICQKITAKQFFSPRPLRVPGTFKMIIFPLILMRWIPSSKLH